MRNFLKTIAIIFITTCLALYGQIVKATNPLEACFVPDKACPALHSIKKQTNPGKVRVEPGVTYKVTGQNKPSPTYYQLQIEGIATPQRWVAVSCGQLINNCDDNGTTSGGGGGTNPNPNAGNKDYLLAISWQAGFCQTHKDKKECTSQTETRFDATHLTLHGLWPQPQNNAYCGVSDTNKSIDRNKRWHLLPEVMVDNTTRDALSTSMPGVLSNLDRHEWIKHGTCYGTTPDEYFDEALMLLEQVNNSLVRDLFADNIGNSLSATEIRAKFDAAFGAGAGNKVNVKCDGKLISELWLNLQGEIKAQTQLADLLKNAPTAQSSCQEGKVDPVGF